MNDSELDDRLRNGLRSITDAAGDPPAWPETVAGAPPVRSSSVWKVAVAMAVLVVLVVAGLVALSRGRDRSADQSADQPSLFGTSWWLAGVAVDGTPLDIGDWARVRWEFAEDYHCDNGFPECEPGPRVFGNDACNTFERDVRFDDGTATWGVMWLSTAVGCSGELSDAFAALMRGDSFTYSITGQELRLAGSGTDVTFTTMSDPLGPPVGTVLDEGRAGDIAYRLTWQQQGLGFESLDVAATGYRVDAHGLGGNPGGLSGTFAGRYLMALLPGDASSAIYVAETGSTTDLTVFEVGDTSTRPAGHLFDTPPGPGTLVAFDSAGNQIGTLSFTNDGPGWVSIPPSVTDPPTTPPSTLPPDSDAAPYEQGIVIGDTYRYALYDHCGVEWARIDGGWWRTEPLNDGGGNPPPGWANPYDHGTLRITNSDTADYTNGLGETIVFTRTDITEPPLCS
jgi:hypothetical protein